MEDTENEKLAQILNFNVPNFFSFLLNSCTVEGINEKLEKIKDIQKKRDDKALLKWHEFTKALHNDSIIEDIETNEDKAEKLEIEKLEDDIGGKKLMIDYGIELCSFNEMEVIKLYSYSGLDTDKEQVQRQIDKQLQPEILTYKKEFRSKLNSFDIDKIDYLAKIELVFSKDYATILDLGKILNDVLFIQWLNDTIQEIEQKSSLKEDVEPENDKRKTLSVLEKVELFYQLGIFEKIDNFAPTSTEKATLIALLIDKNMSSDFKDLEKYCNTYEYRNKGTKYDTSIKYDKIEDLLEKFKKNHHGFRK